jgi:hypothetical protein
MYALQKVVGDETTKVGQGKAFKNKWITKEGSGFVKAVGIRVITCFIHLGMTDSYLVSGREHTRYHAGRVGGGCQDGHAFIRGKAASRA